MSSTGGVLRTKRAASASGWMSETNFSVRLCPVWPCTEILIRPRSVAGGSEGTSPLASHVGGSAFAQPGDEPMSEETSDAVIVSVWPAAFSAALALACSAATKPPGFAMPCEIRVSELSTRSGAMRFGRPLKVTVNVSPFRTAAAFAPTMPEMVDSPLSAFCRAPPRAPAGTSEV